MSGLPSCALKTLSDFTSERVFFIACLLLSEYSFERLYHIANYEHDPKKWSKFLGSKSFSLYVKGVEIWGFKYQCLISILNLDLCLISISYLDTNV